MIANLRGLSLSQPWAWCMTMPAWGLRKEVENRVWPCPPAMIGKRFAIHAARSWDKHGAQAIFDAGLRFPGPHQIPRGAIIALATVDRQVTKASELTPDQRRWFFGPFGFVFRDVSVLSKPIHCKGMLGFWAVPEGVVNTIRLQLVADAREYATSRCTYTKERTEAIVRATERMLVHGSQLDDAAWLSVPAGTENRGAESMAKLDTMGGV